jgi:hypothetical protein
MLLTCPELCNASTNPAEIRRCRASCIGFQDDFPSDLHAIPTEPSKYWRWRWIMPSLESPPLRHGQKSASLLASNVTSNWLSPMSTTPLDRSSSASLVRIRIVFGKSRQAVGHDCGIVAVGRGLKWHGVRGNQSHTAIKGMTRNTQNLPLECCVSLSTNRVSAFADRAKEMHQRCQLASFIVCSLHECIVDANQESLVPLP